MSDVERARALGLLIDEITNLDLREEIRADQHVKVSSEIALRAIQAALSLARPAPDEERFDPAISGNEPVAGHADGCGAHDDYQCDCALAKAPVSRDVTMAAVKSEIERREEGLEFDERGDLTLYLVWALKPGAPQIISICRSKEIAERYKTVALQIVPGCTVFVEPVLMDHLFARKDVQSIMYRTRGRHRLGLTTEREDG